MYVATYSVSLVVDECATLLEFYPYLRFSYEETASAPDSG